jgi:hypothetical protein
VDKREIKSVTILMYRSMSSSVVGSGVKIHGKQNKYSAWEVFVMLVKGASLWAIASREIASPSRRDDQLLSDDHLVRGFCHGPRFLKGQYISANEDSKSAKSDHITCPAYRLSISQLEVL